VIKSLPALGLGIGMAIHLIFVVEWSLVQAQLPNEKEEAYEYNRQGMIAMSKAEFEEAIDDFQKAASLAEDYQIVGRPLIYTPVFMTAWANEKLGRTSDACRSFKRYLQISATTVAEETKIDHARGYVAHQCR